MEIFVEGMRRLWNGAHAHMRLGGPSIVIAVMLCCVPFCSGQTVDGPVQPSTDAVVGPALPNAPSPPAQSSNNFASGVGTVAKTIGEDEWHFIKAPFHKKALIWDGLFLASTGVLIANDESVMYQVPVSWRGTSHNVAQGALAGTAGIATGIYLTGLFTKNEHEQEVGIRTAEATVDSVIMYGALKAIFQRQRPFSGVGEGKFFAGNWTNGSFPSGHSMFTWTIASAVAHQYHSIPLDLALYGLASTVTVTRVTGGQHFPSDVFVGSILGYLIGDYVAHKQEKVGPIRAGKFGRVRNALLEHVEIGIE
jgi:PAP2 superfamily